MASCLRRGLFAGLVAGLLAGVFNLIVGEPLLDRALHHEAASTGAGAEVFSRAAQKWGLVAASVLYGAVIGGLFSFVYVLVSQRLRTGSTWERSLRLAAAAFAAIWLVPFLKYPTNPPGVGDPATIGLRTSLYLAMVGVSLVAVVGAFVASRYLFNRGIDQPRRQLLVGAGYVALISAAFTLLPGNPDSSSIPASLLWNVRLVSAAAQALLWGAVGVGFALLSLRAERREGRTA
ncbi:MAG TPA: CbtA family protein [Actinomycetota bacterium]|jgi:hypothetical protein|nr:CbtA family protein [Actinomycetota bacterium]